MPKEVKEKQKQLYRWAFTWWTEGEEQRLMLIEFLNEHAKQWTFQQERGEESQGLHWQGRLSLNDRKRKNELIKMMAALNAVKQVRISEESDKGEAGSTFYTQKKDTRVDGPWTDKDKPRAVPDEWQDIPVPEWWDGILEHLETQTLRQVAIVVNKSGNIGKSAFVKRVIMAGGISIPCTMDTSDKMMQWVHGKLKGKDINTRTTIVLDVPRATAKKRDFWCKICEVLECLKDGRCYDWRYQVQEIFFKSPRLIVFTNEAPPVELLTGDRWVIFDLE